MDRSWSDSQRPFAEDSNKDCDFECHHLAAPSLSLGPHYAGRRSRVRQPLPQSARSPKGGRGSVPFFTDERKRHAHGHRESAAEPGKDPTTPELAARCLIHKTSLLHRFMLSGCKSASLCWFTSAVNLALHCPGSPCRGLH